MSYREFIYIADLLSVAVFAVTGAIAAPGKRLVILGVVVLGIVFVYSRLGESSPWLESV